MINKDRLAIIADCTRVCFDNAFHADESDLERFLSTFTEGAVLTVDGERMAGRDAIGKSFKARQAAGQRVHVISNLRIDPRDAVTAEGDMYVAAYDAPSAEAKGNQAPLSPWIIGRYTDSYTRTADGWKIAVRAFRSLM